MGTLGRRSVPRRPGLLAEVVGAAGCSPEAKSLVSNSSWQCQVLGHRLQRMVSHEEH